MISSKKYHDIFDYPLVKSDYPKWSYKNESITPLRINATKGQARIKREQISKQKLKIAQKASKILSRIPTIKFVGVTGSLAMMNAKKDSDIDLMIITKAGTLWTTRLLCYMAVWLNGYKIRNPRNKLEKDMLCINLWLDKDDLLWNKKDRNIYTAHEIAQIVPLVNKNKTYEKFLYLNKWVLDFWPNAVDKKYMIYSKSYIAGAKKQYTIYNILYTWLEKLSFYLQYKYMKPKITREVITPTCAIFHPNDWGKVVMEKLKN